MMRLTMDKNVKSRFAVLAALLALGAFPLGAQNRPIDQGSVEVILGGYDMDEPRFDAVYPKGGLLAGLAASAAVVSNLNLYLEAKYWQRQGELTFSKEETTLRLFPISLGLRYVVPLGILNPYAGAGGDIYFYYEDNAIGTTLNHAEGYHVMAGTYLRFAKDVPLMINLRAKYTWVKAIENDFQIKLGGLEYSVGFALAF
jgi:hypothetical protein